MRVYNYALNFKGYFYEKDFINISKIFMTIYLNTSY